MDLVREISDLKAELIDLRRDFHKHPELGLQEFRTGDKVAAYLGELGCPVVRMNKTGVVGLLKGAHEGPTLLLRADMDALPITEETGLAFASVNQGVMHACGHDAHTAILMIVAKILCRQKQNLKGNIKFLFEPNEENVGALAMIQEGAMDNPRVDACMGLHVWNSLETGQVGITPGPVMAGMEHFEMKISGRGGHTASPQNAVDPILAAAAVIQGVQAVQTREVDALKEPTIIMFGKINGGTASNVIPDAVALSGTMRYIFSGPEDSPDHPRKKFMRVVSHICAAHRAECDVSFVFGHPTLVNHEKMVDLMTEVATQSFDLKPEIVSYVTLAGEDFSEFAQRAPGVFCFVGAGKPHETIFPHHHSRFDLDENAMPIGVELLVRGAMGFFEKADDPAFLNW